MLGKLLIIPAALVLIGIGVYYRLFPVTYNISVPNARLYDQVVLFNLKASLKNTINAKYSYIPENERAKILNSEFSRAISEHPERIADARKEFAEKNANKFFKFYLLEADSYYYLHLTENILSTGKISDKVEDGQYFDPLMKAPNGEWRKIELHPYIGAFIYKLLSSVKKDIPLDACVAVTPIILFILVTALFLIVESALNIPKMIIFISGFFFVLSPIFLQRSSFGWYDTDSYNVLFLLLAILPLLNTDFDTRNKRTFIKVLCAAAAGSLYSLFWQGWTLLASFIILFFAVLLIKRILTRNNPLNILFVFVSFMLSVALFSMIALGPAGLRHSLNDIRDIFAEFLFIKINPWPDILLTVGELKVPTLERIAYSLGNMFFFIVSLMGFIFCVTKRSRSVSHGERTNENYLLIAVFYLLAFILSKTAQRFIIFLLPAAALTFSVGLTEMIFLLQKLSASLPLPRIARSGKFVYFLCLLPLVFLLKFPLICGYVVAVTQRPIFNVVWEKAMNDLRTLTEEDAIINSWWPPGHFIKAIADRRVTFDGATINSPEAYWMATFLLSPDQDEALGILRMLNLSGNKAADFLTNEKHMPLSKAVSLIKKVVALRTKDAEIEARKYLNEYDTQKLLTLTHDTPPESYCFLYDEMAEDAIGFLYVKNWDFDKLEKINVSKKAALMKGHLFWRGSENNVETIWSIAGGFAYIGKESRPSKRQGDVISFDNGVIYNTKLREILISNLENKVSGIPQSISFLDNGLYVRKNFPNWSLKLSVLLTGNPDNPTSCIVAPTDITTSMLFRLYYLEGRGLNHFEKFSVSSNPAFKTKIIIYKIKWD
ncbi:MAG: hypothetical protein HQL28_01715 [Candidatus Omnitrophica bacterium]|nr:hypothetical protein [Candidatus Omnitrophota bacterium]